MDLSAAAIILLGSVAALWAATGLDRRERQFVLIAFAVHVLGSFAHWAVMEAFYGNALDAKGYQEVGIQLAKLVDSDFPHFAPEVAKLALHAETHLPFEVDGDGSSTGTMSAIAAFFIFLGGPSLLTMCLATSWISWFGQLCLYRIAREELDQRDRTVALAGIMFVPSVIFWSAGFVKEAFVLGFFGVLAFSTYRLLRKGRVLYLAGLGMGGAGVALLKPYTLVAYVVGVAAFIYADRAWKPGGPVRVRLPYLVLTGAVSMGGLVAIGTIFPEFGADRVAATMAQTRATWEHAEGGSNVELGGDKEEGTSGQIQLVPLAFVNTFFRPALFEARNPPMLVAAMETTLLALAALSMLWTRRGTVGSLFRSPFLFSGLVFVFVFGIGVGLATRNLGSLSRYRMPMMPFYATALLVLRRRGRENEEVSEGVRARAAVGAERSRPA